MNSIPARLPRLLTWSEFRLARPDLADAALRSRIDAQFLAERKMAAPPPGFDDQRLFELRIATCLLTRTTGHGDHDPQPTVWKAG